MKFIRLFIFGIILSTFCGGLASCSPKARIARIADKYNLTEIKDTTIYVIDTVAFAIPTNTLQTQQELIFSSSNKTKDAIARVSIINDTIYIKTIVKDTVTIPQTIIKSEPMSKKRYWLPFIIALFIGGGGIILYQNIFKKKFFNICERCTSKTNN